MTILIGTRLQIIKTTQPCNQVGVGHLQSKGNTIMTQDIIFDAIMQERIRQDMMHSWNRKTNRLAILVEEVGEIAMALQGEGDLQEELVQLASVCVRWLEDL